MTAHYPLVYSSRHARRLASTDTLLGHFLDYGVANCRLTPTSGSAYAEGTSTTLYLTPYLGNRLGLYDGSLWQVLKFSEKSLSLSLTSGSVYDVFAYISSGDVAIETLVWTSGTARATALTLQDGVYVKNGDATRRYMGTICASATNTVANQENKRYIWNMYNRVRAAIKQGVGNIPTWNYNSDTWRQANGAAQNQIDVVNGLQLECLTLTYNVLVIAAGATIFGIPGIGYDVTNANNADVNGRVGGIATIPQLPTQAVINHLTGIGKHFYAATERTEGGQATFASGDTRFLSGLTGSWSC